MQTEAGPEAQFCPTCGMALNLKAAVKLEEERTKADHIMNMLMKDEDVRKIISRKISELCASSQLPHIS
jgi:hypothetical protein